MQINYNNQDVYIFNQEKETNEVTLLINLGSPMSPAKSDVRKYLSEFLMDKYVINIPYPFRFVLVNGIIAPFRCGYSSGKYQTIWDKDNQTFPLISESLELGEEVAKRSGEMIAVAMRYGKPSILSTLQRLRQMGKIKKIKVLPLYPHYTYSTFETAWRYVELVVKKMKWRGLSLTCLPPFYQYPKYRKALVENITPYLKEPFDKLLISLHGIPITHLEKDCRSNNGENNHHCSKSGQYSNISSDIKNCCYRYQGEKTYQFLQQDLNIPADKIELVYQSRLGKNEWMKPYIWERIDNLPQEGKKRILITCPSFVCECLETLSEIDTDYRLRFMNQGGEQYTYIPCISKNPTFVSLLIDLIKGDRI